MRIFALTAAALVFLLPTSVAASSDPQPSSTVHVGDGTLDPSFLVPYNNAWFYSVKFADGRELPEGIWSDRLQAATLNGKQVLLRVQGTTFIKGVSNAMLNYFDPKTLAPIMTESHDIDGSIFRRTFDGTHVTSVTLANAQDTKTPIAAELPTPVYDFNGGMFGLLLASLPFKAGLEGTLPAIGDRDTTMTAEPFKVLRQEMVDAGAHGQMMAWVVDSARPGNYTMRFWLSKQAPYILKLVMTDEAHGRTLTWQMI